jgi:BirA family biotin operon repressor/biotin-[acetyl-CoA-carboxylase] ligase
MGKKVGERVELYNEVILEERLKTKWLGKEIMYKESINSTNDYAREKAEQGCREGVVVFADTQSMGRGTNGKKWESPSGTGVWASFILKPDLTPTEARGITVLAAFSIVAVLRYKYQISAMIKWPNDVICSGKKVAGILAEMSADENKILYDVIGIGINVNMKEFPESIMDVASSLFIETSKEFSRVELLAEILQQFEKDYETYKQKKNLSMIIEGYNAVMINRKKEIRLIQGTKERRAIALGLCENGELEVEFENGTIERVCSGEVSIRGLHDYI